jgi:ATP phosphoribosyltransferase
MSVAVNAGFDYERGAPGRAPARGHQVRETAREHFAAKGVHVDLIKLYGSMELAPLVGLSDAIVDVVSTGSTLRANNLVEVERSWRSRRAWWSTRPRSSSSASACNPSSRRSNAPQSKVNIMSAQIRKLDSTQPTSKSS